MRRKTEYHGLVRAVNMDGALDVISLMDVECVLDEDGKCSLNEVRLKLAADLPAGSPSSVPSQPHNNRQRPNAPLFSTNLTRDWLTHFIVRTRRDPC